VAQQHNKRLDSYVMDLPAGATVAVARELMPRFSDYLNGLAVPHGILHQWHRASEAAAVRLLEHHKSNERQFREANDRHNRLPQAKQVNGNLRPDAAEAL
jgi:hypothetical protein